MKPQTKMLSRTRDATKRPLDRVVRQLELAIKDLAQVRDGLWKCNRKAEKLQLRLMAIKGKLPNGHPTLAVTEKEARRYFAPNAPK